MSAMTAAAVVQSLVKYLGDGGVTFGYSGADDKGLPIIDWTRRPKNLRPLYSSDHKVPSLCLANILTTLWTMACQDEGNSTVQTESRNFVAATKSWMVGLGLVSDNNEVGPHSSVEIPPLALAFIEQRIVPKMVVINSKPVMIGLFLFKASDAGVFFPFPYDIALFKDHATYVHDTDAVKVAAFMTAIDDFLAAEYEAASEVAPKIFSARGNRKRKTEAICPEEIPYLPRKKAKTGEAEECKMRSDMDSDAVAMFKKLGAGVSEAGGIAIGPIVFGAGSFNLSDCLLLIPEYVLSLIIPTIAENSVPAGALEIDPMDCFAAAGLRFVNYQSSGHCTVGRVLPTAQIKLWEKATSTRAADTPAQELLTTDARIATHGGDVRVGCGHFASAPAGSAYVIVNTYAPVVSISLDVWGKLRAKGTVQLLALIEVALMIYIDMCGRGWRAIKPVPQIGQILTTALDEIASKGGMMAFHPGSRHLFGKASETLNSVKDLEVYIGEVLWFYKGAGIKKSLLNNAKYKNMMEGVTAGAWETLGKETASGMDCDVKVAMTLHAEYTGAAATTIDVTDVAKYKSDTEASVAEVTAKVANFRRVHA